MVWSVARRKENHSTCTVHTYHVGRYEVTMNKGRNFTLQSDPSRISGPKLSCAKIYKRRCLILRATKRTE